MEIRILDMTTCKWKWDTENLWCDDIIADIMMADEMRQDFLECFMVMSWQHLLVTLQTIVYLLAWFLLQYSFYCYKGNVQVGLKIQ